MPGSAGAKQCIYCATACWLQMLSHSRPCRQAGCNPAFGGTVVNQHLMFFNILYLMSLMEIIFRNVPEWHQGAKYNNY